MDNFSNNGNHGEHNQKDHPVKPDPQHEHGNDKHEKPPKPVVHDHTNHSIGL